MEQAPVAGEPRRRRRWATCGCALAVLGALLLWSGAAGHGERARRSACLCNLRSMWSAIATYTTDHDGLLPPTANGWCDTSLPYNEMPSSYSCPSAPGGSGGYAYNEALHPGPRYDDVTRTPMVFDAVGGAWNVVAPESSADRERHRRGWNTLFVDGHVKWRKAGTKTGDR